MDAWAGPSLPEQPPAAVAGGTRVSVRGACQPPDASAPGKERRPRGGGLEDSAARPAGRPPALRSNRLQDSLLTQRRGFFPRPCRLPGTLGKLTK